ncbi:PadR family transcriptional regulator [Alicyclobacillus tolerans]|uniref:DNA-binding PadR family transcriptional regulator n=1 Tax=Alicyclobacillus tolerans TaxID=90970 RepID=A0ABT9LW88_9BACL|nr:PadR family transcriptional regulator [Alicyclobacillus tengchongensis]MDP9728538.1 DNA-binding PadR family transcriptional regulator [Alicyclobacillus tengchongensis]
MEINTQVLKGYIDTIILSLLNEGEMYGYQLANAVRERTDGNFELKEGTMYLSLKRLQANGFIESYWGGNEGGGARRKYYYILDSGKKLFDDKVKEWRLVKSLLDTFLKEGDDHDA